MTRNYSLLNDELRKYDLPFTLMKKQFDENFEQRNENNEFMFEFNQSMITIKSKLKHYH